MIGCVVPGGNSPTESTNNSSSQWKEDDVLKILIIGNSFSHDTMEYVWQIADETLEEEIKLGVMYVGSCTLAQHAQNAKQNVAAYIASHPNVSPELLESYGLDIFGNSKKTKKQVSTTTKKTTPRVYTKEEQDLIDTVKKVNSEYIKELESTKEFKNRQRILKSINK
jgi:hypothetical protein